MMLLAAFIYWAAAFATAFLIALVAFTILDWILDR